jgi:Alternative oxidase.
MELLESHAVDTYSTFLKENEEKLKTLPPPMVALSYYKATNLYLFDDFQVSKKPNTRRPPCDTLYDVFRNINDDEAEHVKTMKACKDYSRLGKVVVSPHMTLGDDIGVTEKRKAWLKWSEETNKSVDENQSP